MEGEAGLPPKYQCGRESLKHHGICPHPPALQLAHAFHINLAINQYSKCCSFHGQDLCRDWFSLSPVMRCCPFLHIGLPHTSKGFNF